jgi:hypothetical protein
MGVKIVEHADSAKSFYTFKIDNTDMAAKDIRILDFNGKSSWRGRVEMRLNGRWGSICKKQIEDSAGKMMCVTLGFKDGKIKNPDDDGDAGFCKEWEDKNWCGTEALPIHY